MSLTEDAQLRTHDGMALRVLASGSCGNCSVLVLSRAGIRRVCLIDLGVSPRRTARLLAESGLSFSDIDDVLLTHLDSDHLYGSWSRFLPGHVRVRVHQRHARGAAAVLPETLLAPFDDAFVIQPDLGGATVAPVVNPHDSLGSVAYRIDMPLGFETASLGFATDLGHVADRLITHLKGVDVLAIESNYCPRMQEVSGRPEFLKRRIMGGAGHLSNQQSCDAVRRIGPCGHVVLLHLSQECNLPDLAASGHREASYGLTVANQHRPTDWVRVVARRMQQRPIVRQVQASLFEPVAAFEGAA